MNIAPDGGYDNAGRIEDAAVTRRIPVRYTLIPILLLFVANGELGARWELFTDKNTIRDIAVDDRRGTVFFSSGGGLIETRSETGSVESFRTTIDGLTSNDLTCLAFDSAGNLLIGTVSSGLSILFADGEIRNYSTFDGLPSDDVLSVGIPPEGDELWVGTAAGAVKMEIEGKNIDRKSSIYFGDPLNYEIRRIRIIEDAVWFATSDGLWSLEDERLSSWKVAQGLADNSVTEILVLPGDSILIGTADAGFQLFGPGSGLFHDFSSGLTSDAAREVRAAALIGGELWAATRGGVFRSGLDQASWVDETLDLPTRNVQAVAPDASDAPLVGTVRNGVGVRVGGGWDTTEFPGPLVNSLDRVMVDGRGVVWASSWSVPSSNAGVFRYDGSTCQNYTSGNSGLMFNLASSLNEAPDGTIWMGTPFYVQNGSGVSILDDGGTADLEDDTWTHFRGTDTGLSGDALRSNIAFKGTDEAWLGSWDQEEFGLPGGLDVLTYGGEEPVFRSFSQLVPGDLDVQALALDRQGDLWIGYRTSGVDIFVLRPVTADGDSLFFSTDPSEQYLVGKDILDLQIDPLDHLWIATASGVTELDYGLDPLNSSAFVWRSFTMDNSPLPDIQVNAVAFHGSRYVWFATPSGAARYDREKELWTTFDTENSPIPSNSVNDVFVDGNTGSVWFATEAGLARYSRIEDEPPAEESGSIVVAPNPYVPGRHPEGVILGRFEPGTRVDVYSIAGVHQAGLRAQAETIRWDGTNSGGAPLSSGVYILISRAPDGSIGKGKIAIVR